MDTTLSPFNSLGSGECIFVLKMSDVLTRSRVLQTWRVYVIVQRTRVKEVNTDNFVFSLYRLCILVCVV